MKQHGKWLALLLALALPVAAASCGQDNTADNGSRAATSQGGNSDAGESDVDTSTLESAESRESSSAFGGPSAGTGSRSNSSRKISSDLFNVDSGKKSPDPLKQNIDLKKYEFVVIDFVQETWNRKTGVDKAGDLRAKIIKDVEKGLNCTIKYVHTTYGKFYSTYQAAMLSGEKVADILSPTMYEVGSFISAGLASDLKKVPNLNLDRPYWNNTFSNSTSFRGKVYAMSCALNMHLFAENVILYNKQIVKELGLPDPYELVRKKEWTIDVFIDMAKKAKKDIDGVAGFGDNDRYGLAAPNWAKSLGLFMGSGLPMLQEKNGKIEFFFKPSKTAAANGDVVNYLNKLKEICVNGENSNPVKANQKWDVAVDQFVSGRSLFFLQMLGTIANPDYSAKFLNMKDDFGVLPIPSAKKGANYYNIVDWNTSAWIVPVTNKTQSKTGIILEALAYHSYYDYQTLYINEWCDKYLRDDDSVEMVSIIQKNPRYDYALLAGISDSRISDIINKIIVNSAEIKGYDPAQAIPMYEDSVRKGVDEFFNS